MNVSNISWLDYKTVSKNTPKACSPKLKDPRWLTLKPHDSSKFPGIVRDARVPNVWRSRAASWKVKYIHWDGSSRHSVYLKIPTYKQCILRTTHQTRVKKRCSHDLSGFVCLWTMMQSKNSYTKKKKNIT